jgi:hypothetical protein
MGEVFNMFPQKPKTDAGSRFPGTNVSGTPKWDGLDNGQNFSAYAELGLETIGLPVGLQLLVNPAGSGKRVYIWKRFLCSFGDRCLFQFFINPIIYSPGVPKTITSLSASIDGVAPYSQQYSYPSVKYEHPLDAVFTSMYMNDAPILLNEGTSILVVAAPSAINERVASGLYFTEVPINNGGSM